MNRILVLTFCLALALLPGYLAAQRAEAVMLDPELRAALPSCASMPDLYRENCNVRALREWVRNHLAYPEEARTKGEEGRVEVAVMIDTLGRMSGPRVIRKRSPSLDKEALRIVRTLQDSNVVWLPAVHHGHKVISEYRIPVDFHLTSPGLRAAPNAYDTP